MANQFTSQLSLENYTQQQFLMLCMNTCNNIGWQYRFEKNDTVVAYAGNSLSEEVTITVDNNIAHIKSSSIQWRMFDGGKNKKNVTRFIESFNEIKDSFLIEDLDRQAEEVRVANEAYMADFKERFESGRLTATEKMSLSQGKNYVTYALIALNILVFILMCVSGVSAFEPLVEDLVKWGGNIRFHTANGEWWRLITNVFVHIGIIHVAMNMYALFYIGSYLEPILGKTRYIIVYLCTGIIASVTSIWWSGDRISAGASGAIFGLYGVFLALLTTDLIDKEARKSLLGSISVFVVYNLIYGMKGNIDNAAHIGGLVSGFIAGYILYIGIKNEQKVLITTASVVVLALSIAVFYLSNSQTNDMIYQKSLNEFSVLEEKALEPLKGSENKKPDQFAQELKTISLPAWKKAKEGFDKILNVSLPENLSKQRMHFRDYTSLRIRETELLILSAKDTTGTYTKELNGVENSISTVFDLIKNSNK